jgi:enamine deaminase RidA (YjgF/YER057c/UK114 family)
MQSKPEVINPAQLGKPSGYSNGIKTAAGALLFVAGQIGTNQSGEVVSADFAAQFSAALANALAVVRAAGGGPENIARLTIFVVDRSEYLANRKAVGAAYRKHMGGHFPAMSLLEVKGLLDSRAKVELEATAVL